MAGKKDQAVIKEKKVSAVDGIISGFNVNIREYPFDRLYRINIDGEEAPFFPRREEVIA